MPLDKYAILINEVENAINICDDLITDSINNKVFQKYPDLFFVYLTTRLTTTIQSSVALFKIVNQNNYNLLSIAVLLRSSILDCLHFYYLIDINSKTPINENQEEIVEITKRIHCNQIYHVARNMDFLSNKLNQKISTENLNYFQSCLECFSDNQFTKAGTDNLGDKIKKEYKKGYSAEFLVENTTHVEPAHNLYECYVIYSKYEHYGEFTHRIYEKMNNNLVQELNRALYCIHVFFKTIIISSSYCDVTQYEKLNTECTTIADKILAFTNPSK